MAIKGIKYAMKLFSRGSVCVCGQRGRGKDLLMSNVAVRQGTYVSNIYYGANHIPLDFGKLDVKNVYKDIVTGQVKRYVYPYPPKVDIFISDIGIHFPAQYCDRLNREFPSLPTFLALSRQLGSDVNVHWNTQVLNRCWDKFREQSDTYLLALGVFKPLLKIGIVVQRVREYELYDACIRRVPPFLLPPPKITASKEIKQAYEIEKYRYDQTNGRVREHVLIYRNKASYDDKHFKRMFACGEEAPPPSQNG